MLKGLCVYWGGFITITCQAIGLTASQKPLSSCLEVNLLSISSAFYCLYCTEFIVNRAEMGSCKWDGVSELAFRCLFACRFNLSLVNGRYRMEVSGTAAC